MCAANLRWRRLFERLSDLWHRGNRPQEESGAARLMPSRFGFLTSERWVANWVRPESVGVKDHRLANPRANVEKLSLSAFSSERRLLDKQPKMKARHAPVQHCQLHSHKRKEIEAARS